MLEYRVLLAPDTQPDVGLGHVSRCSAVAYSLAERDVHCTILVPSGGIQMSASPTRVSIVSDLDPLAIADRNEVDLVVIDGYGLPARLTPALRAAGRKVVAIDDNGLANVTPDLVVNPNAHAVASLYAGPSLIGPSYAMIRDSFKPLRNKIRDYELVRSIVICMGGADPQGYSSMALDGALDALVGTEEIKISVILGPMASKATEHAVANRLRRQMPLFEILHAPVDFPHRLAGADLAILSGGVVLTEALYLGIPVVALAIAENQRLGLAAWISAGAVVEALPERSAVANAVYQLLRDSQRRRQIGDTARALLDGKGADRIAAAIIDIIYRARNS